MPGPPFASPRHSAYTQVILWLRCAVEVIVHVWVRVSGGVCVYVYLFVYLVASCPVKPYGHLKVTGGDPMGPGHKSVGFRLSPTPGNLNAPMGAHLAFRSWREFKNYACL